MARNIFASVPFVLLALGIFSFTVGLVVGLILGLAL